MDLQSPLTQQTRPNTFLPKIVDLYNTLIHDEHEEVSEGFWREFFLLRPEAATLRIILNGMTPDELVHEHSLATQRLFQRAYHEISEANSPSDTIALDTLAVFLDCVLNKRYASPNSDTIAVLAGLDDVDHVFTEFVAAVDGALRETRPLKVRSKAINLGIIAVSGAYRTGLVSYFINRDLFPALIKIVRDTEKPLARATSLCLLSLLLNYNKFEFQNPYLERLEELKDVTAMSAVLESIGATCALCRDQFAAVQDDIPEGWNLGGALSWFGLGGLTRTTPSAAITDEAANIVFSALPTPDAVIMLSVYDFTVASKAFRTSFVTVTADSTNGQHSVVDFLSLSSYLFQHAHRSPSASSYACLSLLTIHSLLSDPDIVARICNSENAALVCLGRQKQPVLPVVQGKRVLATVILDLITAGIEHNIIAQIDIDLYHLLLGVLLRLLSSMATSRLRLSYHWSSLWQALQHLLHHLDVQSTTLSRLPYIHVVATNLVQIFALAISSGESIIPDTTSHDDLFSKVHSLQPILPKVREAYLLQSSPAIDVLLKTSKHCKSVLDEHEKGGKKVAPREVGKVLRQSFEQADLQSEALTLELDQGLFREAEWRPLLKKIVRVAVQDAQGLVARSK